MNIVVSYKAKWGKDLFYPESKDAFFLTKFTGRPTLLINQLRLAIERGWSVKVIQKQLNLEEYIKDCDSRSKGKKHE